MGGIVRNDGVHQYGLHFCGSTRNGEGHIGNTRNLFIVLGIVAIVMDIPMEGDLLATILLHDVCEDCGVTPAELPVNENVRKAVELLTFEIREGETDEDAHERYFTAIKTNRLAVIVKIIDRCNNLSTMMGSFDRERMIEYIEETEKYVFPLMDLLKFGYDGKYYDVAFLIKYHILSVVHNDKHALTLL